MDIDMKYYRFGSNNSLDEDYLVDHPNATGTENDTQLITQLKLQFPEMLNWHINIIKIIDGKIVHSIPSKGSPDSVHNSLLSTYNLHEQSFACPIFKAVERDITKAINKCILHILTFYKKTDKEFYKKIARVALKSQSLDEQIKVLGIIDFDKLTLSKNETEKLDSLKKISFRIAQTISLINNIEIYTKNDLIEKYPELTDIINRKPLNSYNILNIKIKELQKHIILINKKNVA